MALIAAPFYTRISIQSSLANDIEAAKQEAHIIATMSHKQPITEKEKANLIQSIKTSIEYTNTKVVFLNTISYNSSSLILLSPAISSLACGASSFILS